MTKRDLCEVCGTEFTDSSNTGACIPLDRFIPDPTSVLLTAVVASDPRFARDAYIFVQEALDRAQKMFWEPGKSVHISGQKLLEALRELTIESFGKRAKATLNSWGIFKCEDFGEIVFNLVEAQLLAKSTDDDKAEFQNGFDFDTAFPS